MRKMAAVVVLFIMLLGSTAFAEDGFSVSLGYGGGYKSGDMDITGLDGIDIKGNTPVHGPNFEARYEQGAFFGRLLFNYNFLQDGKTDGKSGIPELKYDGHDYSMEANIGYKIMATKEVSVVPYAGFGYHEWQANLKNNSGLPTGVGFYFRTPYGAIGLLTRYEQPLWSVGLDATALITFGGSTGASINRATEGVNQDVGWGARVQIPITYNILPKKSGPIGIDVFLTPYFEYWDTQGTSSSFISGKIEFSQYTYGGKAGLIFKF